MHKSKFVRILSRIIFVVGITVGIIFTAVGATMIVNASLKLAFFDEPRYANIEWRLTECESGGVIRGDIPIPAEKVVKDLSEEEIADCKEAATKNSKAEFERVEKETIVDGVSSVFVGLVLWIAFGIWGKRKKEPHNNHEE